MIAASHEPRQQGEEATGRTRLLLIEVGPGELIDKITILRIKAERIGDPARRANVAHELAVLEAVGAVHLPLVPGLDSLSTALASVNAELWAIEDDIRLCEASGDFGSAFVALARAVYQTNDRRAALKKQINLLLGATIVEEKSYAHAPPDPASTSVMQPGP